VAYKTATHFRNRETRRRARQHELIDVADPKTIGPRFDDLAMVVDRELTRLPDKYRAVFLLCELEGRSLKEAAQLLGIPVGTIASRLARARSMLADQLRATGVVSTGGVIGVVSGSSEVAPLFVRVVQLASGTGAPVSTEVQQLATEVACSMTSHKLNMVIGLLTAIGIVLTGLAVGVAYAKLRPADLPQREERIHHLGPRSPADFWLEDAWTRLVQEDSLRGEMRLTQAILTLSTRKNEVVPFLKKKLKPLTTDKETVKKHILALGSDKKEEWEPAVAELRYQSPLLVMDVKDALAETKTPLARRRLAGVLVDLPIPNEFPAGEIRFRHEGEISNLTVVEPGTNRVTSYGVASSVKTNNSRMWLRAARAVLILDHHGGADAKAILKELASGHPDAMPTILARRAYDRHNQAP
jgi:hypothetical protein